MPVPPFLLDLTAGIIGAALFVRICAIAADAGRRVSEAPGDKPEHNPGPQYADPTDSGAEGDLSPDPESRIDRPPAAS